MRFHERKVYESLGLVMCLKLNYILFMQIFGQHKAEKLLIRHTLISYGWIFLV